MRRPITNVRPTNIKDLLLTLSPSLPFAFDLESTCGSVLSSSPPSGCSHSDGLCLGIEWIFWYADDPGNGGASLIKNTPWARMPLPLAGYNQCGISLFDINNKRVSTPSGAERAASLSPSLFLSVDSNRYNDPARYRLKHFFVLGAQWGKEDTSVGTSSLTPLLMLFLPPLLARSFGTSNHVPLHPSYK